MRYSSKPVGWRNDSYRHYLAAKGISTKKFSKNYYARDEARIEEEEIEANKRYVKSFEEALTKVVQNPGDFWESWEAAGEPENFEMYGFNWTYVDGDTFLVWRQGGEQIGFSVGRESDVEEDAIKEVADDYYAKKSQAIEYTKAPKGAEFAFVGTDSKGRTVRLYDDEHKQKVDKAKFRRLQSLEKKRPVIEARIKKDINSPDEETRETARAAYIILKTGLRPGTTQDTQGDVKAYGLTTLDANKVSVKDGKVRFKFIGKKGVAIDKTVKDPTLAKIVKEQKAKGNKELFPSATDSTLRNYVGKFGNYKTKDLRTLYANEVAKKSAKQGKSKKEIIAKVADELQNTPGVAAGAYIEPKVLQ